MAEDQDLGTKNEALLKRIRQRYTYGMDKWQKIRKEGQTNIRYVSGDPWDDEDKEARKGRPTVCADELNQYVNQVVNTARMSPRGIKIDPAGDTATSELAEYRENRIRAIEYACNASQAYLNGLQAAVERNLGYWKVTRGYVDDESDEQEILILPVMNPDSQLMDPDYKELDGSDRRWHFELDRLPLDVFETEYPDAEKKSFSADDFGEDGAYWYDGKSILLASYWEVRNETKTRGKSGRKSSQRKLTQYITNGCEILKKTEQPGPFIPVVPVMGKELWVDNGSGAERFLLSLVSLARDPQKALAYVMSSMMESTGGIAKSSFIGWKGQFETDEEAWGNMNQVFHPYLQLDPDGALDGTGTPLQPLGWAKPTPDFTAYSVGADICRRAIQAAMGISPLPTAAQRSNQKSGVALEKIQNQQSIGSYHLVDSYDRAIKLTGRIVNGWIAETDLGEGEKPVREADGKHKLVRINTDQPVNVDGHEYNFPIADDKGRYQVTVSSGVSNESQRSEASDFGDTLVSNLKNLPVAPQQAAQMLALVIRMKQLGPLGDQMADIISPQQGDQAQAVAQLQAQGAQMQEMMQEMKAELGKLQLEKAGKVIEGQFKMEQTKIDKSAELEKTRMQETTKLAVAQISASKDANEGIAQRETDQYQLLHDSAHEVALQNDQQQHEKELAEQQAAQQAAAADQQAGHQAALQDQQAANQSVQSAQDAEQAAETP